MLTSQQIQDIRQLLPFSPPQTKSARPLPQKQARPAARGPKWARWAAAADVTTATSG